MSHDGGWKLHCIENPKGKGVRWELYDLAADPTEVRDLVAAEPDRAGRMQQEFTAWLGSVTRSLNGEGHLPKS